MRAIIFPFWKIVKVGGYVLDLWTSWKVTRSHEERLREGTTGKWWCYFNSLLNSVHQKSGLSPGLCLFSVPSPYDEVTHCHRLWSRSQKACLACPQALLVALAAIGLSRATEGPSVKDPNLDFMNLHMLEHSVHSSPKKPVQNSPCAMKSQCHYASAIMPLS